MTMGPNQTAAAIAARRRTTDLMNERVRHALAQMRRERAKITFAAVARRADVSRTFLYQNDDARRAAEGAATEAAGQFTKDESAKAAQLDAAWRERALNAEELVKAMGDEVRSQRRQLATLLGRIRDLEGNLPADAVQRLASENTTLKVRLRQQTQEAGAAFGDDLQGDGAGAVKALVAGLEVGGVGRGPDPGLEEGLKATQPQLPVTGVSPGLPNWKVVSGVPA